MMNFQSILFIDEKENREVVSQEQPDYFIDLNLDQVINAITAKKQEYDLKPFFYSPLIQKDTIQYRHEIFRDLENTTLLEKIKSFNQKMSLVRRYIGMIRELYFKNHKLGWFLEMVALYCEAVNCLVNDLSQVELKSDGFLSFGEYLKCYAKSEEFLLLKSETKKLKSDLSTIQYCVQIKGDLVKVRRYEAEIDYTPEVEKAFEKFKQGAVKDYMVKLAIGRGMNHVEAQILDRVAKLYPEVFNELIQYYEKNRNCMNSVITDFDREIQFYVSYMEYVESIKMAGLKFCLPEISITSKDVYVHEGFDLALASQSIKEQSPVICNDFSLSAPERIIVVSGPNQGGKTTFARMFGQLHFLASMGCPIPGKDAQIFLFDRLFTHFEKEEDIKNLRGKLKDDVVRIHTILEQATPNSVIILNEIFTSTTLKDAIFLSKEIMNRILKLDSLCVCVTFIDELASLSEKTVSMVSTVVPENPAIRTFKILRKPADGLAYALSIAEKYRLTYHSIKKRMQV